MKKFTERFDSNHHPEVALFENKLREISKKGDLGDTIAKQLAAKKKADENLEALKGKNALKGIDKSAFTRVKDRSNQVETIKKIIK